MLKFSQYKNVRLSFVCLDVDLSMSCPFAFSQPVPLVCELAPSLSPSSSNRVINLEHDCYDTDMNIVDLMIMYVHRWGECVTLLKAAGRPVTRVTKWPSSLHWCDTFIYHLTINIQLQRQGTSQSFVWIYTLQYRLSIKYGKFTLVKWINYIDKKKNCWCVVWMKLHFIQIVYLYCILQDISDN